MTNAASKSRTQFADTGRETPPPCFCKPNTLFAAQTRMAGACPDNACGPSRVVLMDGPSAGPARTRAWTTGHSLDFSGGSNGIFCASHPERPHGEGVRGFGNYPVDVPWMTRIHKSRQAGVLK